jgi:hypothetical protein
MGKLLLFGTLLFSFHANGALEVIRPVVREKIVLHIVRAIPDSFETYSLTNNNGREMTLVCAHNRVYDDNARALIEYRNFYNEEAGRFSIESDSICKEMGKFIEQAHSAIDEQRPFVITLNVKKMSVEKIVYPRVDPYADTGDIQDLMPKKEKRDFPRPETYYLK